MVEPVTRGDPESPLRWTSKSVRRLADELQKQGHKVSAWLVAELLRDLGYSLQANSKTMEGGDHPDRNAQFEHFNSRVEVQIESGNPAISVDTKKKGLVGDFKNAGRKVSDEEFEKVNLSRDEFHGEWNYTVSSSKG